MNTISTEEEESVCKSCGLCCDGTLFSYVELRDEDDKSDYVNLGVSLVKSCLQFGQPCVALNLNGDCGIYLDRPCACREFSCKLLGSLSVGEVTREDALGIIENAKKYKSDLVLEAQKTGAFPEGHSKECGHVVKSIKKNFLQKRARKIHPVLHLKYAALQYFLNKHFHMRGNKPV